MRPVRRRGRGLLDVLAPLDRLDLVIGPSPRRAIDPDYMEHMAALYRRFRAEVWAATDPELVPDAFWRYEENIPLDLRARHAAGDWPSRIEVLDRLEGIRR